MEDLLFFDIEVFSHDAFVVFKNIHDVTVNVFHNNFVGLLDFVKGKTLIGFNNYHYDDHILHAMFDLRSTRQLKSLNDRIISGENLRIQHYKYDSLDVYQQLSAMMPGLKRIEANCGKMIFESTISFDIDRPLSDAEFAEALRYCEYDTSMVITIYKMREKNYFEPKKSILKMLDNPYAARWNTTTMSANVLTDKKTNRWSGIKVPDHILDLVPAEISELWHTKKKGSITIKDFDNEIVFGFGGLHAQNMKKKRFMNVINLDVASLYPSIIVNYEILGREATAKYKEILEERIRIKHTDPERQAGLKLILNSVYGLLKSEHSLLCNEDASTTVCAIGQAILYDLSKRLSAVAEIVQINTDGVAFIPYDDSYKDIASDWELEHSLTLEEDIFPLFVQRDVNNYIAITPEGKIKTKGGDVSRYHADNIFANNNVRIVDKAIVDKLLFGKDILETLYENTNDPKLYQYCLQAGRTFKGVFDDSGKQYNKINRVFAAKEGDFCLYKVRPDGAKCRFPDAPLKMYLHNGDCDELKADFHKIVDLNHYYQIILKKLERWT